ncbi:hypothetical protein Emag_002363 [Eimeria magna]
MWPAGAGIVSSQGPGRRLPSGQPVSLGSSPGDRLLKPLLALLQKRTAAAPLAYVFLPSVSSCFNCSSSSKSSSSSSSKSSSSSTAAAHPNP